MRPEYESPADRTREQGIRFRVGRWLKAELIPTPRFTNWDAWAFRGGCLVGILEIKCRSFNAALRPELDISEKKIRDCLAGSSDLDVPFALAISASGDWIGVRRIDPDDFLGFRRGRIGRTDRNDPADLEDGVFIPISSFTSI